MPSPRHPDTGQQLVERPKAGIPTQRDVERAEQMLAESRLLERLAALRWTIRVCPVCERPYDGSHCLANLGLKHDPPRPETMVVEVIPALVAERLAEALRVAHVVLKSAMDGPATLGPILSAESILRAALKAYEGTG